MTLDDLYTEIVPTFTPSTQKDLKTAVHVLASALGYAEPKSCPLDAYRQPLSTLQRRVESYLRERGKGPYTVRNTKNNLARMFARAEVEGLMTLIPERPAPLFNFRFKPPRPGTERNRKDGTGLGYHQWPPALRRDFDAFRRWATDPFVPGRDARWRKRHSTVNFYQGMFGSYFGFLHHVRKISEPAFNQLFDFLLIEAYIHWHVNEKHQRSTVTARSVLTCLMTLTRQYRPQPELRQKIRRLFLTLSKPTPTYQKADAWVPLTQLYQIGEALWPSQPPEAVVSNGKLFAFHAGMSVLFQLWTYIPYRARNMREMALHDNLYRDSQHTWHIRFSGEQLKIGVRQGRPNVFHLPFPVHLVPRLETYLNVWRPLLQPHPSGRPQVFLNRFGETFNTPGFYDVTRKIVHRYSGKHWHPHNVRTVWATEYIREKGDFYGAAVMLNDTFKTVVETYAHLREENVADTAYQWVQRRFTP